MFDIPVFNGEFGFELTVHIPFVNYLFTKNALKSCKVTKSMEHWYAFLPSKLVVVCADQTRSRVLTNLNQYYAYVCCCRLNATPVLSLGVHQERYDMYKPPVFKGLYKNILPEEFEKPLLIIHNKYTTEWGGPPVNHIRVDCLKRLVESLCSDHCIVYIHPTSGTTGYTHDNQALLPYNIPNELSNKMTTIQTLMNKHKLPYNIVQLALHDQCSKFISVQGGSSRIASCFDGTNVVLHKQGSELTAGSYDGYFKQLSRVDIRVVSTEKELVDVALHAFGAR